MINRNKLEHILEYAKQQRHIGQYCKIPPEDMVEIMERLLSACNSPVIPDGWVACSERMPDDDDFVYIWPRPDFGVELHVGQYCECHPKGDGWYAQVCEQNYGIEWCPITVTHWMPLPAAPQEPKP